MEHHYAQWFQKVEVICSGVDIEPAVPHSCGRQIDHSSTSADTPLVYYCHTISIPLLDYLVLEVDSCLNSHQQRAMLSTHIEIISRMYSK